MSQCWQRIFPQHTIFQKGTRHLRLPLAFSCRCRNERITPSHDYPTRWPIGCRITSNTRNITHQGNTNENISKYQPIGLPLQFSDLKKLLILKQELYHSTIMCENGKKCFSDQPKTPNQFNSLAEFGHRNVNSPKGKFNVVLKCISFKRFSNPELHSSIYNNPCMINQTQMYTKSKLIQKVEQPQRYF